VGLLVRRSAVPLEPLLCGGEQEGGLRPGTEDVAGASAAALAVELAVAERESHAPRLRELEGHLCTSLMTRVPAARLLGPPLGSPDRLPGTLNVLLPGVEGKVLVTRLDLEGLEASAGSACASGSLEPSHVLLAMGLDERAARAGLRLSLGRASTWEDVRQAVDILVKTCGGNGARR
jgi:cysteine desulfurase